METADAQNHKILRHILLVRMVSYKRYTIARKLEIIQQVKTRRQLGESLRSCAARFGLQATQLKRWLNNEEHLKSTKRSKKSLNNGRQSTIHHLREAIVEYINEERGKNLPVSYHSLVKFAGTLDPLYREEPLSRKYYQIRRLVRSEGITIRARTNTAQAHPAQVEEKAVNWMIYIRPIVSSPSCNKHWILNMDETPIPFSLTPTRTLTTAGERTVGIRRSGNSTTRCTAALTCAADGTKLKPFVIFKGKVGGRIHRKELPTYNNCNDVQCTVQDNSWMDQESMNQYIQQVLVPYVANKPDDVDCILIIDTLKSHVSAKTIEKCASIGIQVEIIPGGCTSLTQPCDIGINKPFKDRLKGEWWKWIEEGGLNRSIFNNPTRETIGKWIEAAWQELPEAVVRNSWRKTDFEYFEEEEEENEAYEFV
jgi:transposase-like protein